MVPIAGLGNFLHIYDFYVEKENIDEFIRLFNEFDYGGDNPMHKSPAQVKDAKISVCHGVGGMFAASGTIIFTNDKG